MSAIKERPILFSAPMVRAILEGRKTVTRRAVKIQPRSKADIGSYGLGQPFIRNPDVTKPNPECPYGRAGDRLWVALRAIDLPREAIARIGYALCEADPRRDLEQFADVLDWIMAVAPQEARAALAPHYLDPDYRAALQALERTGDRMGGRA